MREGDRFGAYLLEELLAKGGMAEVFRARREGAAGFSRQVCIKRILPALCGEREFVEMFIDEARTGAQLRHGNIVAIDDFGEIDGQYFLCMELVSGVDLSRLCTALKTAGRVLPIDAAAHVTAEMLKALDYAHRKLGPDGKPLGLVHRDVSPHNVLVSFAGEARLTDFGIAKARTRLHQTTGFVVKGKIAYMAPEQARGHAIDGRADLFALGASAYEVLAGRRPFTGANESELVVKLLKGERPRLRELRGDVPEGFERVIDRLLATEANARFATAGDALDALNATGLVAGGSRSLADAMAFCFPEHPSALRRGGGAGASLPPAAGGAGGTAEEKDTAPQGAKRAALQQGAHEGGDRTLVDPTLAATPRAREQQGAPGARPHEVTYSADVATRLGTGAVSEGQGAIDAPRASDAPRAAMGERTEAQPGWGTPVPMAQGNAAPAAMATRTSLRPAGPEHIAPELRTRTSMRPGVSAEGDGGRRADAPRAKSGARAGMPGWALVGVGVVGLVVGVGIAAALVR